MAMFWGKFFDNREAIEEQYRAVRWREESGLAPDQLRAMADAAMAGEEDKAMKKARAFACVLDHAQLAVEPAELFQDHIRHDFILQKQRREWEKEAYEGPLRDVAEKAEHMHSLGVGAANSDYGHTVPDWYDVLQLGFPGLLARLREYDNGSAFYRAGIIAYEAAIRYARRLAAECRRAARACAPCDAERLRYCAEDLEALAQHEPRTLHQALQLAYLFHILQEEIEGERLRSLGGLDRLYFRFYWADLQAGRITRAQAMELWQDFFQKFHALTGDSLFGEPMYLGGELPGGACAVNELTDLILEAYDELNIANPKFHIRVSKNTPSRFLRRVLDCVRRGNSSFVFISDACAIPMMQKVGATLEEAREYVPIGCYEPGILGREVACTGNGGISLPKAVELALNNGRDALTGEQIGPQTGEAEEYASFENLLSAVREQTDFLTDWMTGAVVAFERHYMEINPSPLFSATLIECVRQGKDAYAGGAKYNNSSCYLYSNGTMADELAMIRKHVYQNKECTLAQLNEMLLANWEGHEAFRLRMRRDEDKWGNNRALPDEICRDLCAHCAARINATANGRGGRFKASLFTIDYNYFYGERLGASADGRKAGEILSRNVGAASTMDRSGVTALIASACKLDFTEFPTGSVLDVLLHPSAVAGEDGLRAFEQLILTYCEQGGYAIHGNVMDARVLRDAQAHPEKYPHLQVRVCGWNVYFVNLSRAEQDEFIARAEA